MKYDDIDADFRIHTHKNLYCFHSKDVPARDVLNSLLNFDCELEIAYILKEDYNDIKKLCNSETIENSLDKFIKELIIFNIDEFKTVVSTIKK